MKGKSPDSSQTNFLMNGLGEQLNPRNSIYQLSKIIDWESLENDFTHLTATEVVRLNLFV